MFYRLVQTLIRFALGRFYRIRVQGMPEELSGPIIFVGNHPNSLVDPAMVFVLTERKVTFLAKEPLFRVPLFGRMLRGLDALPVYRKQDHPGQMSNNEGTFVAATQALKEGRAITIFPEGKSHSEPQLAEIKTGCARIALRAYQQGAPVRIIPIGFTYADKHRFRSWVQVDVGAPIRVETSDHPSAEAEAEAVRRLTEQIANGLRAVTLNLEQWADLRLVETAEQLYAFRLGEEDGDVDRIRRFARGLELFRRERPEAFEQVRAELASFRRRLDLVQADPKHLTLLYRRSEVYPFILRNLAALFFGFPLFALGCVLFVIPFMTARLLSRVVKVLPDRIATLKLVTAVILSPLWWAGLTWAGWYWGGRLWGVLTFVAVWPLALFTRYFLERRRAAIQDVMTFFVLGNRARLKAMLLVEGEKLSAQIDALAAEYRPRISNPETPAASST